MPQIYNRSFFLNILSKFTLDRQIDKKFRPFENFNMFWKIY